MHGLVRIKTRSWDRLENRLTKVEGLSAQLEQVESLFLGNGSRALQGPTVRSVSRLHQGAGRQCARSRTDPRYTSMRLTFRAVLNRYHLCRGSRQASNRARHPANQAPTRKQASQPTANQSLLARPPWSLLETPYMYVLKTQTIKSSDRDGGIDRDRHGWQHCLPS